MRALDESANPPHPLLEQCQTLFAAAAFLAIISVQCVYAVMSPSQRRIWTDEETTKLLRYLTEQKSRMAGAGAFKNSIFSGAAKATTKGVRTPKQCSRKWDSVSDCWV
jgi:hypothetical protein